MTTRRVDHRVRQITAIDLPKAIGLCIVVLKDDRMINAEFVLTEL